VALEDVAAGEPEAGLKVGGAEHLAFDHAAGNVRGKPRDGTERGVGGTVALDDARILIRRPGRDVLREDAHRVRTGRRDARVVRGLEVQLTPRRRGRAPPGRVTRGL